MSNKFSKYTDLVHLAFDIISKNGLLFFLRSVYLEYKRNGFQILEREISLIGEFTSHDDENSFKKWLYLSRERDERLDFENNFDSNNYPLSIIISNSNNQNNNTQKTIQSIENQSYPIKNLYFISQKSRNTSSINFKSYDELKFALKNDNSKYLLFMKPGCILTEKSLWKLSFFLKNTDADIVYCDEDQINLSNDRGHPFFKPDWSPDLFLSMDYFSNFFIIKKDFLEKVTVEDYFSNYDLLLRFTEKTNKISHLSDILFSFDTDVLSSISSSSSNIISLTKALKRRNIHVQISKLKVNLKNHPYNNIHKIKYSLNQNPKISIIIPTKNNKKLLERCIKKIEKKTNYKNYEIIIIDNNNSEKNSIDYIESLSYKKIKFDETFNFAKMNNQAVSIADGEFILFMNDDVAPISSDWLNELVSVGIQKEIGIVGPMLIYSNNSIQHGGMIFSKNGAGYHPFQIINKKNFGYFGFLQTRRNYSAVTGACLLIKKTIFDEIHGFDEKLDVYYNDADLCMKVTEKGYRIVFTPYTELLHEGSTSIKKDSSAFFAVENHHYFLNKWPKLKNGDPYYNPNLDWNFQINTKKIKNPY